MDLELACIYAHVCVCVRVHFARSVSTPPPPRPGDKAFRKLSLVSKTCGLFQKLRVIQKLRYPEIAVSETELVSSS